jgi:plasmid stabilization system protein ParE
MAPVVFSPRSRQDLLDIADDIAKERRAHAQAFLERLRERIRHIGDAPLSYGARTDLAPGLRMAPIGRHVIFFRVIDGAVRIERALRMPRYLPAMPKRDDAASRTRRKDEQLDLWQADAR